MAYSESKTRTWNRSTPNDGLLFDTEFTRLYGNFNAIVNNGGSAPTRDMEALNTYITNQLKLNSNIINGLEISNGTDTEHDINIATGWAVDSTGVYNMNLSSGLTKQIDATWAAGTNAGGLDTGSVGNDTWYYIWLIRKDSDGSIDALFSASATSPTMPAGYTYKRRIRGAVLTDGSANIIQFYQKDDYFGFITPRLDYTNLVPGTSRLTPTVSLPPSKLGWVSLTAVDGGAINWWLRGVNQTDDVPSDNNNDFRTGNNQNAIQKIILINASSQVAVRGSGGGSDIRVFSYGFFDPAQS